MMNCQEVESKLLEYCDAPASSELHNQVSLHLQHCETCRNNYKLTRAESEILSESPEIPEPSIGFTSSVMTAIKKDQKLYPHAPIEMIKEQPLPAKKRPSFRIWGSLAAAAILGIGLYSAASYVPFKNVNLVDTPVPDQQMSQMVSIQQDTAINNQAAGALSGSEPVESPAQAADEPKSIAVDKLTPTPKLLSTAPSGQEASRQTLTAAPVNPNLKDTNYTLSEIYIANIPEQFHLTGITKISTNQAEYRYANNDGQQNFTVSVYLVSAAVGSQSTNSEITSVTSVGTQKVILGLAGDLPNQFLQKVADSIQLKTIKP